MATENPLKMLELPWVLSATAQKKVSLGAKNEWFREHGIDCLDHETASQRYAIFTKMHLSAAALHALSYYC